MRFPVGHQPLGKVGADAPHGPQAEPELRAAAFQCGVYQAGVDATAVYRHPVRRASATNDCGE